MPTLVASLRRTPPVSDAFHELRYRRALRQPLQVSGLLTWHGGMAFEREVRQPYREHSRVTGESLIQQREGSAERSVPLRRAPELRVLFEGLAALFAGDAEAFTVLFETGLVLAPADTGLQVAADSDADHGNIAWRLDLAPRDSGLRNRVPALSFHGHGQQARCLVLHQSNAQTLIVLDSQPLPEAPAVAARPAARASRSSRVAETDNAALQARIDQLCPLPGDAGSPGSSGN